MDYIPYYFVRLTDRLVLNFGSMPPLRADRFNEALEVAQQPYRWIPVDNNDQKYLIGDILPATYEVLRLYL